MLMLSGLSKMPGYPVREVIHLFKAYIYEMDLGNFLIYMEIYL